MKYPVHSALLVVWGAGILLASIYDDVLYPMDDGMTSIGIVFLFVLTLASLVARARRDEAKAKAAKNAAPG